MLALAKANSATYPEIDFVRADGTLLPFGDGSFDAAISAATLHHCEPAAAVSFLRELRRVARVAPIVGDLRRTPAAYGGARIIALLSRNRLTKNDAPLSVRRSYTPREAYELALEAGWRRPSVRPTAWFRLLLYDAA
jgi:ubiquinone/menaquinone biosynthesis C-methylase UbiE